MSALIVAATTIVAGTLIPIGTERARRGAEIRRQNRAAIMTLLPQILEVAAENANRVENRVNGIRPASREVRLITQLDLTVSVSDRELSQVVRLLTAGARSNLELAKRTRYVTAAMTVLAEWSQGGRSTAGILKFYLELLEQQDEQIGLGETQV